MKNLTIIKKILEQHSVSRDDDTSLYDRYLNHKGFSAHDMTVAELHRRILKGQLAKFDTITREARMIKEDCPELRGKTYIERQIKKQAKVKTDILLNS
jgi:hypothetical protein